MDQARPISAAAGGTGGVDWRDVRPRRPAWVAYVLVVVAEGALTVALLVASSHVPLPRFPAPYVVLIMGIGYLLGEGPAILAFLLGFLAYEYLFVPPAHTPWPLANTSRGWAALGEFLVINAVAGIAGVTMRRSRGRVEENERKFRTVFDSAGDAIFILDTHAHVLEVNEVAMDRLGYSRDELLSMTAMDIDTPEFATLVPKRVEELQRQGFALFETAHVRKDGVAIPVEVDIRMIEYKGAPAVLAVARDLTRRKRAEEEAAQAHAEAERRAAEFQSFFSSITDGAALFDTDGNVIQANAAAREMLGASADMAFEEWRHQYRLESPDGEPVPVEQYTSRRALRGESFTGARYKLVTPWRETTVSISGGPVRDSHGQILGAALVWHDIRELVEAETKKQELYDREHHVAEVLQSALLTEVPDAINGFAFETVYQAALEEAHVGGDFFDVFPMGADKIGVVIGDVSGKGLAAAVQVAMAKYSIRSRAFECDRPSAILNQVNKALVADTTVEGFVTVFFGVLNCSAKTLTYTNAGHSPTIIWKAASGEAELLDPTGPVLGCDSGFVYQEAVVELHRGDEILLGTDGLYEVKCKGEFLEVEGLLRLYSELKQSRRGSAVELIERVTQYCRTGLRDDAAVLRISVME